MAKTVTGTRAAEMLHDAFDELMRVTTLEALQRCMDKTPVLTGRARNNWNVAIGSPDTGEHNPPDPRGAAALAIGARIVANLKFGDTAYVANGLPYIGVLEHGGPNRTAHAMAGLTAQELQPWVNGEMQRIKREFF